MFLKILYSYSFRKEIWKKTWIQYWIKNWRGDFRVMHELFAFNMPYYSITYSYQRFKIRWHFQNSKWPNNNWNMVDAKIFYSHSRFIWRSEVFSDEKLIEMFDQYSVKYFHSISSSFQVLSCMGLTATIIILVVIIFVLISGLFTWKKN